MLSLTHGRSHYWDYGIMVSTLDCLSSDPSSILGSLVRDLFSKCKLIKVLIK